MLKQAFLELKKEFIERAAENERKTDEKCAQVLLAATGLKMLAARIHGKDHSDV